MEVLITEMIGDSCPVEPQICRIMENDCIGFTVTNRGTRDLVIDKEGQEVVGVSVLVRDDLQEENHRR